MIEAVDFRSMSDDEIIKYLAAEEKAEQAIRDADDKLGRQADMLLGAISLLVGCWLIITRVL